jgi:CRP/FNR family transcriptional regulator, cyclic AMP receptor protein
MDRQRSSWAFRFGAIARFTSDAPPGEAVSFLRPSGKAPPVEKFTSGESSASTWEARCPMLIVVAAWVAAVLVFSSFFMKTMIPLRVVAITSNIAFITFALLGLEYGIFGRVYPILVLHSSLLPLNVLRLRQIKGLINAVNRASRSETIEYLIPYMSSERHSRGETLFRKGDAAQKLYLIREGTIYMPELGKRLSDGAVFGEVGLFAPQNIRSVTALCEEDCRLHAITKDKVLELYYQNPRFGFFLIRMISALVHETNAGRVAHNR